MSKTEALAYTAAQLSLKSIRELPLSVLGVDFTPVSSRMIVDGEDTILCMRRKFMSMEHIRSRLQERELRFYVHKLWEVDVFDTELNPVGKNYYLSYAVRKK